MTKHFKVVKTTLITGVILVSLFTAFIPSSLAGIINVEPLMIVTHDRAEENVIPKSGVLEVNLSVTLALTGIGVGFVESYSLLKNSDLEITLEVEEDYDWIDASVTNSPAKIKIGESGTPYTSARLSLTVTEKAPAFTLGKVKIIATSSRLRGLLFNIAEKTEIFEVPFEVGYWPVVNYELPKGNFIEIGPLDTADFPIEIDNLGNGVTYVAIEIVEIPVGDWSVSVPSSVTLRSDANAGEEGTKATVHLSIKPPYGFGFHNERRTFKVKFTPQYLGNPNLLGQSEIITFNVQNVGMSPGAGFEIPLIVILLVVLFIGIYVYKRRK
jgi:hypothetical protein